MERFCLREGYRYLVLECTGMPHPEKDVRRLRQMAAQINGTVDTLGLPVLTRGEATPTYKQMTRAGPTGYAGPNALIQTM